MTSSRPSPGLREPPARRPTAVVFGRDERRRRFHLTYCSNIHAGETWDEVCAGVGRRRCRRCARIARHDGRSPSGCGCRPRPPKGSSSRPCWTPSAHFLRAGDYYVFTINGFPYGAFHGRRVKEQRLPARLARATSASTTRTGWRSCWRRCWRRDGIEGSVSTVPGASRRIAGRADGAARWRTGCCAHAAALVAAARGDGRDDRAGASSPSPHCCARDLGDAVAFFEGYLFDAARVGGGPSRTRARLARRETLRRHLGACLDACHMAVEFEEPGEASIAASRPACASSRSRSARAARRRAARRGRAARPSTPFAEGTYLHQVVASAARACRATWICRRRWPTRARGRGDRRVARALPRPRLPRTMGAVPEHAGVPGRRCWRAWAATTSAAPGGRDLHLGRAAAGVPPGARRDAIARELEWTRAKLEP